MQTPLLATPARHWGGCPTEERWGGSAHLGCAPLSCCSDCSRDEDVEAPNPAATLLSGGQHKGKQPSSLPPLLHKPTIQQCEVVIRQLWNANLLQAQEVRCGRWGSTQASAGPAHHASALSPLPSSCSTSGPSWEGARGPRRPGRVLPGKCPANLPCLSQWALVWGSLLAVLSQGPGGPSPGSLAGPHQGCL